MKNKFLSISTKYIATVFIIIFLFTVIVSSLWSSFYMRQMWSNTANFVNQIIYSSNTSFDMTLKNINYNVTVLTYNDDFKRIIGTTNYDTDSALIRDRRTINNLLMMTTSNTSSIKDIEVVKKYGEYYQRGMKERTKKEIQSYYDSMDKTDKQVLYLPEKSKYGNSDVDLVMIKRINKGKLSESLVIITIDCSALWEQYEKQLKYQYGFAVYDQITDKVIHKKDIEDINYLSDIPWKDKIKAPSKEFEVTTIHNKKYLLINYTSELIGWNTALLIPNNQLNLEYLNGTYLNFLIIIASILIASLISYLVAKTLTKDIKRLTKLVKNLDSETLYIAHEDYKMDELGILYEKFCEMVERVNSQMNIIQRKEKEKRKYEIKALQAQINPHFLYNSLSTIKILASIQGMQNITDVADALATIMHTNMSENAYITLEEEKKYLDCYIHMKEYQYAKPIEYTFEIEESIKHYKILKLLIQPIVENSLKHANIIEKEGGFISIYVVCEEDSLCITIKDNGDGIAPDKIKEIMSDVGEKQSIGLFNIAGRIRLNYGEPYGIEIDSEIGYFTLVTMKLPLIDKERDFDDTDYAG